LIRLKEILTEQKEEILLPTKTPLYRGISKVGEGFSVGVLGTGIYISKNINVARAFAKLHGVGILIEYRLKRNLKLLSASTNLFMDIKEKYGLEYWDTIPFKGISDNITKDVVKLGYDGIESSDIMTGIVIFDEEELKEIKRETVTLKK
jgi:hypothetical protein